MNRRDDLDMCDELVTKELSTEEKYERAVQEAHQLGEQLQAEKKAQAAYEMGLNAGKAIMATIEGLMDAGLSRKEAFSVLKFSTEMVK